MQFVVSLQTWRCVFIGVTLFHVNVDYYPLFYNIDNMVMVIVYMELITTVYLCLSLQIYKFIAFKIAFACVINKKIKMYSM
jgi:hypothetical protein